MTTAATGACIEHAERVGTPCERCGTFRCADCLVEGRCRACRASRGVHSPSPGETIGFGPRVGARVIDTLVNLAIALVGGFMAGLTLGILRGAGVIHGGADGGGQGFGMNLLSGFVSGVLGGAVTTQLCGASVGKLLLGQRVVRTNGERPRFVDGVVREAATGAVSEPAFTTAVLAHWSPRRCCSAEFDITLKATRPKKNASM